MVTKSNKLQIVEKRELVALIKCRRERERMHVLEALCLKREIIEKPYKDKIAKLQEEMNVAVKKAGYSKLYERGCFDVHPDLDKFDKETNDELTKLWERAE